MDYLKILTDWLAPVIQSPTGLMTGVICMIIGFMLKKTPRVPNDLIPWLVIPTGSWVFTMIGDRALTPSTIPSGNPTTVALSIYGAILGFIAWQIHHQVIKRIFPQPDEPDQPPGPKPPISPGLNLLLTATSIIWLTACATTIGQSLATSAAMVDRAMEGWAAHVVINRVLEEDQVKVRNAYLKYQASMTLATNLYVSLQGRTDDRLTALSQAVRSNQMVLISFIEELKPKTKAILP